MGSGDTLLETFQSTYAGGDGRHVGEDAVDGDDEPEPRLEPDPDPDED